MERVGATRRRPGNRPTGRRGSGGTKGRPKQGERPDSVYCSFNFGHLCNPIAAVVGPSSRTRLPFARRVARPLDAR